MRASASNQGYICGTFYARMGHHQPHESEPTIAFTKSHRRPRPTSTTECAPNPDAGHFENAFREPDCAIRAAEFIRKEHAVTEQVCTRQKEPAETEADGSQVILVSMGLLPCRDNTESSGSSEQPLSNSVGRAASAHVAARIAAAAVGKKYGAMVISQLLSSR